MPVEIHRIFELPLPQVDQLVDESVGEGFQFMLRFVDEWNLGVNRFDQTGEAMYAATVDQQLVGVCGLNRDPYVDDPSVGRLRHLYVRTTFRRKRIGKELVQAVIDDARHDFLLLRLRTDNTVADRFYRSIGFLCCSENSNCSHTMKLTNDT